MTLAGKIRDGLSLRVLTPLARIQRSVRPATSPILRAYWQGLRFRRQTQRWDNIRRERWILERLRHCVRYAYRETSFYREKYDHIGFDPFSDFDFDDFAQLPLLTREEVQAHGENMLARSVPVNQVKKDATGGSTGKPMEVWLGPNEQGWSASSKDCFRRQIGVPEGVRTGLLWGHHLDPKASESLRDRWTAFSSNTYWFDSMRLSPHLLESYHQMFQRWRPSCIIAYASALGYLAEHVLSRNHQPNYPTRCFITGAEKLWSRHRQLIEKAFHRPVHEIYGARDAPYIAMQLEPTRTLDFTVDWTSSFVEPETQVGESAILITKLQADAMPMIRYRIGDLARFPSGSEPGHPAFTIEEILGRTTDRLWLPDGRWISGIQIPHLLKDFPVREFLLLQRQDYSIELQLVPQKNFDEDCRLSISETLKANLPGLPTSIRLTDSISRNTANKWRPVICEVAQLSESTR
jgi:Coenzyme F390 synthetase